MYKLTLLHKNSKETIDTTTIKDCSNRKEAINKVNTLLLRQGLKNKYKISLKKLAE